MAVFQLILCIIAAVVLSSFISRFIPKVSTPLVQIALGAIASQLPFFPDVGLDPELFMVLFIAPLLYLEAHEIDKSELLNTIKLSLSLAIGLAIATMVAVGFILHAIWPAVSLAAALALGAALGPTDAVAVSSLGKEAALTRRQMGVLKGESLFNDASGIVGFQFAIAAATTGRFEVGEAAGEFVMSFIGGGLFGLAIGMIANWLFETIRSLGWETTTTRILMELFLPFLLYLAAEDVAHVSGILSVVASALFIRFDRTGVGPNVARTNIVSNSVWGVLSFTLNGAVFILLGMLLPDAMGTSWDDPGVSNTLLIGVILLVSLVVIVMRFVWVSAMLRVARDQTTHLRRKMTPERLRSAAVMTFGGAKGTITLSLMFTIPYALADGHWFPMRDELIFVASGVIIVTLLLANFLLPLLAPNRSKDTSLEMTEVTIEVLRRTVEELTGRVTNENRRAILMVIDSYTKRITRLKQRVGELDPQGYAQLQIDALGWEKDYVKQRLIDTKQGTATGVTTSAGDATAGATRSAHDRDLEIEACERLLDQIMNSLRHIDTDRNSGRAMWQIKGRLRALQRRTLTLVRRTSSRIRRTTPLFSDDEIFAHTRMVQLDAFDHVIDRLYEEMTRDQYNTEHCSALLLDYRRAESALRARPNMGGSAQAIAMAEDVKRESYGIELGVIQDMVEAGDITRAQAKALRRNVYVMSVDADSSI
ncbi:sodium:proton antiporter [Bifidobacterium ramosum]|uniref:Sodium:proton antiporter n=1 Tax=Bifidobacterium ramosum TaxID=1798158 RepID=A0A6L4WYR9_9BIFI|nr:sodium:proton antiporter [Bifidobacterium ramosum]KAB8287277.1 sodium:proton antiporter [Bifidobacterium ramosum]NEG72454.1 sodium:proton antiporter [Bifidobacterium ramosum]